MFGAGTIISAILGCMAFLVLSAVFTERKLLRGKDLTNNGIVYALSLGIFYSAWTYYGSVGLAARSGFLFFTFYLGATLSAIFWWVGLRKMVRIKNEFRLTSIADFVAARYGKSELVAAIITITTIVGIAPYIALQLRAIRRTYDIIALPMTGAPLLGGDITPIVVLFMIIFIIVFGVRHVDPTQRHAGMVMAVAVESLIQLLFFLIAGIFVVYFVFNGFSDIFHQLQESNLSIRMPLRETPSPFITWVTYIVLAMSAVLFLPRQFHISVVELSNENNIRTAIWLFPAYTFLTTLFMFPIAMAGLLKGLPIEQADTYVLAVPSRFGSPWVSLLIFIGGFAAATSMIMISSMTLATMITLHLALPVMERIKGLKFLERHILFIKRLAVAVFIVLGYISDRMLGDSHALVSIGIMSFAVAAQFVPALLIGIFWRRGSRIGAIWGLSGGILVWFYTILMPAFAKSGWIAMTFLEKGPWGISLLRPEALFGVTGLHHIVHGTLWALFFNITLYIVGSLWSEQTPAERRLADRFVDILIPRRPLSASTALAPAIVNLEQKKRIFQKRMSRFFDRARTTRIIDTVLEEIRLHNKTQVSVIELAEVVSGIEKRLGGAIGAAAAHRLFKESSIFTPVESKALQDAYTKILLDLKVPPEELTRKINYFQEREKLLSSHAQELQEKIGELNQQIAERKRAQEALSLEAQVNLSAAELSRTLLTPISIEDISSLVLEHAKHLTHSAFGYVAHIDPQTGYFVFRSMTKEVYDHCRVSDKDIVFEEFTGLLGWVVKNRKALLTNAAAEDPRSSGTPPGHLPIHRFLCAPALIGESIVGQVSVANAENDYTDQDLGVINRLADIYAIAIQRKQAEEELKKHRDRLEELVKERTAQLSVAKERAESASQAKTAFLANMSHELRTPLNAVIGYAQVLRMRPEKDPSETNALDIIQQSGNHLLTLINDILDLSIIEAGQIKLSPGHIHFATFLDSIANIIQLRAEAKQLDFHMEIPESLPLWIIADETRLRQILLNLLGNAVKYTHTGQVTLRLKRKAMPTAASSAHPSAQAVLCFEIADTGVGIDQEQINRIFQPFEQIRQVNHESAGTGLGLAISRQLVQLMGGHLHVKSEPGQGSVFWFETALPVPSPTDDPLPSPKKTVTGYQGAEQSVLIADDIHSNRAVLVDMLAKVGFLASEAMDGEQAVHLARETRPDLILMDLRMPVLNGFEAATQIRQIKGLEKVVIIAVSASVSETTKAKCLQFGIDAFLPKPVYWPRLAVLIEEHLNIQWIYAQKDPAQRREDKNELVPPSRQELKKLLELTRRGNLQAIYEHACRLEKGDAALKPFASKLQQLAQVFEEKAILALINQYIEE